jgi:UPF0755 protein
MFGDDPEHSPGQGSSMPSRSGTHSGRTRSGAAVLFVFILIAAGVGVAAVRYYNWCKGASGARLPVTYSVKEGAPGDEVVDDLHDAGVLRCGGVVGHGLLTKTGRSEQIRAGTYDLTTNMTLDEVLLILTKVPKAVPTLRLTIPEGYRLTQIADRVKEDLHISGKKLLQRAEGGGYSLPPYLPGGTSTVEGFLFPKTYEFIKGKVTPGDVVERLLQQFDEEVAKLPWENAKRLGVTRYEVVIIASMIEEEAKIPEDRAKIAAVIYNRLDAGMELGIDATLLYDDPTPGDGTLSESDLATNTPYNTRLRAGLPPTPISSPGMASLEAALEPAHVDYLYYVLCGADGHHEFTVGYNEFLRKKTECL